MKLLAFIPVLAASALAAAADAAPDSDAPPADPTPAGALWTATWNSTTLTPFKISCATKSTYKAAIYKLSQLYPDLEDYAPTLKVFYNKQLYPGSWSGVDKHGNERELLMMDAAALPKKVRNWIQTQGTQRHYSVHGEVVFFAPGAVYPLLPLWVEGDEGCGGVFEGLETYSNVPEDGKTIGKISHKEIGDGEVEFTVEAMKVELAGTGERSEL